VRATSGRRPPSFFTPIQTPPPITSAAPAISATIFRRAWPSNRRSAAATAALFGSNASTRFQISSAFAERFAARWRVAAAVSAAASRFGSPAS
jgi:hypothetical protein